jgi:hypothetical protein
MPTTVYQHPVITKDQLQFKDYRWSAIPPDDPRQRGEPDKSELNRGEGYEVLHFLNHICTDLAQAKHAERLIRNHLPGDLRSYPHVLTWLQQNWRAY